MKNILNQCEKLPNKIKLSLEKGKKIEFTEDKDKLSSFINDCINIENNIKDINIINENINKCKNENEIEIKFNYDEQLNLLLEVIKVFGNISVNNDYIIDSELINKNEQDSIINWIKEKINKNEIKFQKIFVMSVNGDSSKDFHKYCDNKGPTLTIVKTTQNKIFGGFAPLNWVTKDKNTKDNNEYTILFSLNL